MGVLIWLLRDGMRLLFGAGVAMMLLYPIAPRGVGWLAPWFGWAVAGLLLLLGGVAVAALAGLLLCRPARSGGRPMAR